jgi:hypothetical protein
MKPQEQEQLRHAPERPGEGPPKPEPHPGVPEVPRPRDRSVRARQARFRAAQDWQRPLSWDDEP